MTKEAWDRLHRLTPAPQPTPLAVVEHAIGEAFASFRHMLTVIFEHPHPHDLHRWHDDGGPAHPHHD